MTFSTELARKPHVAVNIGNWNCPNLISLPDGMQSLKTLYITGCPHLERRCEKEKGEDWPKIAHVREIRINGWKYSSLKGWTCSREVARASWWQHIDAYVNLVGFYLAGLTGPIVMGFILHLDGILGGSTVKSSPLIARFIDCQKKQKLCLPAKNAM
ncbi:unnamed protein product, partial [Ilex paraguariensis]